MECFRVQVPDGVKIAGVTAAGHPSAVLPGEYLVHRLRPKTGSGARPLLRFVGADALGRDVHVPLDAVRGIADFAGDAI
jgi:hypothetical protein